MVEVPQQQEEQSKTTPAPSAPSSQPSGEQAHKAQVKGQFQTTSLDLWQLYKQSLRAIETSFLQGREEAFNEVMKYLVMLNKNSDFRYVPITEFINYIESRYNAHREDCEVRTAQSTMATTTSSSQPASAVNPSSFPNNMHLVDKANKEVELALESLSKQARVVAQEQGPLTNVQSRLAKLSFDIFKVKGTKKRKHPGSNSNPYQQFTASEQTVSSALSTMQLSSSSSRNADQQYVGMGSMQQNAARTNYNNTDQILQNQRGTYQQSTQMVSSSTNQFNLRDGMGQGIGITSQNNLNHPPQSKHFKQPVTFGPSFVANQAACAQFANTVNAQSTKASQAVLFQQQKQPATTQQSGIFFQSKDDPAGVDAVQAAKQTSTIKPRQKFDFSSCLKK